jgi:hypothetical protein
MREKESRKRNSACSFWEKSLELVSEFKVASSNFIFIFSVTRRPKNFKTSCAFSENIDLIL